MRDRSKQNQKKTVGFLGIFLFLVGFVSRGFTQVSQQGIDPMAQAEGMSLFQLQMEPISPDTWVYQRGMDRFPE